MKVYYVYDPKTYAYAGQVACDNQPESATPVPPIVKLNGVDYQLTNAKFNPSTNTWEGANDDLDLRKTVAGLTAQIANLNDTVTTLTQLVSAASTEG